MATPVLVKRIFLVAAVIAGAAEGALIYRQWPSPPLKVCASVELGELLATASRADAALREARTHMRTAPNDATPKEVMSAESASAAAWNAVTDYKQKALERQKASGAPARGATCS